MRILVSSSPGVGHLLPLLPVARAAAARGHEVLVAVGAGLAPIVQAAGLRHHPTGPATIEEVAAGIPDLAGLTGRRRALVTGGGGQVGYRERQDLGSNKELAPWVMTKRVITRR